MKYGDVVLLLIRTKTLGNGDEICYFHTIGSKKE